jgi:hypothetical protein
MPLDPPYYITRLHSRFTLPAAIFGAAQSAYREPSCSGTGAPLSAQRAGSVRDDR